MTTPIQSTITIFSGRWSKDHIQGLKNLVRSVAISAVHSFWVMILKFNINPEKTRWFPDTSNMILPFLNLPGRIIIMVVQAEVSSIHRKNRRGTLAFRGYGRTRCWLTTLTRSGEKITPIVIRTYRHKSIFSRAKCLCQYGVLYDAALVYLAGTFGKHEISEDDIRGMVINNYNANRGVLVFQGWICTIRRIRELHTGIRSWERIRRLLWIRSRYFWGKVSLMGDLPFLFSIWLSEI